MTRAEPIGVVPGVPRPKPGDPPLPNVPRPWRSTLASGLRLVAVPWGTLPQIAIKLILPAGSLAEPADRAGLAGLTGRLLTEGTERHSADALNARLDLLGASVDVSVGHDFAEIELFFLSETLDEVLPLFADLLVRPAFPEREVERARLEVLDAIASRADEPANVADDRVSTAVFGADHPYGRPSVGRKSGVRAVTRDEIVAFHAERYRPDGAVLVAAGRLDPEGFAARLAEALGTWSGRTADSPLPPPPAPPPHAGETIRVRWKGAQQAEIRVAGVGLARRSPDWIPAAVANYILGGSTITGRLGANLREAKGWTYGARSSFSAGLLPGGWMADTAVDVAVRDAALREILAEVERMVGEPVGDEEIRRAQDALVLSLPRAFETPGRVVSRFVTLEAFGLAPDYWESFPEMVRRVTPDELARVARVAFDPASLVRLTVG